MNEELSRIDINGVTYYLLDENTKATAVTQGRYNSSNQRIELLNADNNVVSFIDATNFIKDGMVSNVSIVNGNLVITFNTDSGKSPISIPLTSIFNPSNYYQKSEIDSKFSEKQSEISNLKSKIGYYECSSEASNASKIIAASNYVLENGGSIKIKMTNVNTANNATLNINSTGAKPLYYAGERASATNSWGAGETVEVYYDGSNFYANNVAGGGGDGVFDVSAKYPTSGVGGGNTYTLEGALAVLNDNLSASKKKGGMSIKFIHSSDNNSVYVQYRLMSDEFSTDVADWQGVDDEPTTGSKNLVESSGTKEMINSVSSFYKDVILPSEQDPDYSPYISEVFILDLPAGECVCKCYNDQIYLCCLNPIVYARSSNVNSNGIYECTVYKSSDNINYPHGKTIGYVMVNDYEGFCNHSTTKPDAGKINKAYCDNIFNSPKIYEFLNNTDERLDDIEEELYYDIIHDGSFLTRYEWYNTHEKTVGSTPPDRATTTDDTYGGIFHAKKGKKYIIGSRTTTPQDYGRPVFIVVNNLIVAIASSNDALTTPFVYNAQEDCDIYINCNPTYYNDFYIKESISVKDKVILNENKLNETAEDIDEINRDLYIGNVVNNPTIQRGKAIQISGSEATYYNSGACSVFTENIPADTTEIRTKFNSVQRPDLMGYIFYGENDTILGYGQSLAGSDYGLNGVWQVLPVPPGALKFSNSIAVVSEYGLVKFDYEGIKTSISLEEKVSILESEIEKEETEPIYSPSFNLPKEIHAIKNDKILLFKSAFGNNLDTKSINVENAYCRDFPRYIEVNPTSAVDSTINFSLLNEKYEKLGINTVTLKCVEKPVNPSDTLNILMVGSSSTANYKNQYEELYRRLALTTGTEGNVSNPKGLGLSNVNFIGRLSNGSNFRYEATGGFAWGNYANPQGTNNNYSFIVSNPSDYNVDDVYTDGTYDFTIKEISQSDNRVSANCATQNAPISSSGSFALKSGTGPQTFVYSSYTATITHPFDLGNGVSLSDYMAAYCNNAIPHIIVFQDLVFNSGCVLTDAIKTKIVGLFNLILTEYPDVKILMSSEPLPSALYGLGTNYVTSSQFGRTALITYRLHKLVSDTIDFIEQFNTDYGSEVVMFVPQTIECDAEYDYPYVEKDVNFRVTSIDEKVGTNGAHPTNEGILNRVDAFYRSIAYCIKNFFN